MKKALFSLILAPCLLAADESFLTSETVSFDGNTLKLEGNVHLNHMLGKMESKTARLKKEEKEGPFSSIFLNEDVLITLKNRGKISCGQADFDFVRLRGTLLPKRNEMIKFFNLHSSSLTLRSKIAELEFCKDDDSYKVVKINAQDTVSVKYGDHLFLEANQAVYANETIPCIYAFPKCIINHFNDVIESDKVELFPETSRVVLSSPKGSLKPGSLPEEQDIKFTCDRLIWDHSPQLLLLHGNVQLQNEGLGDFHCEEEIEIHQKERDKKWVLSTISTKGKTTLNYHLDADFKHQLICYGKMRLDQERLVLTLESPLEQPIEYFHDHMKLNANQAQLDYTHDEHAIKPQRLLLSGDVRLIANEDTSRCAIADQFTYLPEKQTMILSSQNGDNVLFWDQTQDLSISAREVHLVHGDKGEKIKGVGNVRFAFTSTENELLKKIFPFYKPARSP